MRALLPSVLVSILALAPAAARADTGSVTDVHKVAMGTWAFDYSIQHQCPDGESDCEFRPTVYQTVSPSVVCPADPYSDAGSAAVEDVGFSDTTYGSDYSSSETVKPAFARFTRLCLYADATFATQYDFDQAATTPSLSSARLPKAGLEVDARTSRSRLRFDLTTSQTGCLHEDTDASTRRLYLYSGRACGLKSQLVVHRKGKVQYRLDLLRNDYFDRWRCKDSGRYRWTVSYSNPRVYDSSAPPSFTRPLTVRRKGTYVIPRCRPRARRAVGRGLASAKEYRVNQDAYDSEFISAVHCSAGGRSRSSVWICQTTHNNTYRECIDTDRLIFTKRDKWGRRDLETSVKTRHKHCHYY